MEQIKTVEIKDICLGIYEGPHATPKNSDTGGIYLGIPALDPKGFIDYSRAKRIAEEDLPLWTKRVTPQEDDIVFTNEATLNLYAIIPANFHGCLGRRLGLIRPNKDLVNVKYLFYYFFSPEWRETVAKNKVSGATVDRILMTKFPSFPVSLPSLKTQERIANILSVIDGKIEVNRQINDNLEQQAQALYKSWFIDNYQTEWPEYSLDEVTLKITDGVHNTVIDTPNGEYYLLSCKNIKNRRLNMSSSDRRIDEGTFNKLRKRTMMSKGDILLSSVGTIGELMLLNEDPHNYEFQRSVAIIKPNPVYISSYYLYETLISQIDKITNTAHGAVQQCIFLSDLKEYTINIADKALISRYDIIVKPFFDEITKREKEIARLTSLRDSLLPKLMSGELKINEIDC